MSFVHRVIGLNAGAFVAFVATAPAAFSQAPATVLPSCPTGQRVETRVGFDQFECKSCRMRRDPQTGMAYLEFNTQPVVRGVGTSGQLRDGDILLAVDGKSLLTPEGARLLATLPGGAQARFSIRRAGNSMTVMVTPDFVCRVQPPRDPLVPEFFSAFQLEQPGFLGEKRAMRLDFEQDFTVGDRVKIDESRLPFSFQFDTAGFSRVWAQENAPSLSLIGDVTLAHPRPGGWFGFALSCDSCSNRGPLLDGKPLSEPAWPGALFNSVVDVPPQVVQVDSTGPAARAGLRVGDLLVSINGTAINTPEGRDKFLATNPGDTVVFRYSRGQLIRSARVVAGSRPLSMNVQQNGKATSMRFSDPSRGIVIEVTGTDITFFDGPTPTEKTITGKDIKIVVRQVR